MLTIAISFVMNALWLILSPLSLSISLILSLGLMSSFMLLSLYAFWRKLYKYTFYSAYIALGMIMATIIYIPALSDYKSIANAYPLEITGKFKIISNQYESSTTIKIIHIESVDSSSNPIHPNALKGSSLRIYNIPIQTKDTFNESEIYQGSLSIRPRYFRNFPGDDQRILQSLARKDIGYGKLLHTPLRIEPVSFIESIRAYIEQYFLVNYKNGAYLSALSVGKTEHLSQADWSILRKTGTIHLISISGLHLSLTAFYGFIIFRILFGLSGIRKVPPYKLAAMSAIMIAWAYALIAGMSLPTIRAAIMFSIAMLALLINRPILSLQSVAIALLLILSIMPLSLLMPGFSLSFIAVIILILCAQIFTKPLYALLLTQITISLLLLPLTASFFGEISLISPFINLFVIPWTSIIIMPFILIGTIFLLLYPPLSYPFLRMADEGINILRLSISWASETPYAFLSTTKMPLYMALIMTLIPLFIMYLYPIWRRKKN